MTPIEVALGESGRWSQAGSSGPGPLDERSPQSLTAAADRALAEAIRLALQAAGYAALRELEVEFGRDFIVLSGRVPTYHQKQVAQAAIMRIEGVREIVNHLEVEGRR